MRLEERDWTIPLAYLLAGTIWIGLSDELLFYFADQFNFHSNTVSIISQWKGFCYVGLTTFLLYYLIKRKTKSLEFVKNDFRRFFQDNPNPMYIFEINTQHILLANKAAGIQYGYLSSEMSQLTLGDLRPSSELTKLQLHLKDLKEEFSDSGEWLHQDKFGNSFYVNIYSHKTLYKRRECRIVNAININKNTFFIFSKI
jgi:hypothetical protein